MKWIKGNHPKIKEFSGIIGSGRYLVRYSDNGYSLTRWLGDRWVKGDAGGNIITHYMFIEAIK